MSNPAGWKDNFFQAGFYYAIKDSVLCYPSRLWTLFTYMFPITLLFLRSFFPPLYIFSCAIHCILFSTHHQHLSLCRLVWFTQQCPLLSVSLPASLINLQIHLRHVLVSCFKLLKLNKRPGVVHFSAVKHPGACRLARAENTWCQSKEYGWNKCVCNCRWKKENTKQLAATMHADYCHMLLIYEQCLLWQRCLIFIVFELLVSWSRSWLTCSIKKPFKIWKMNAVICYCVILND